jgi:hypothetical protein
MQAHINSSRRTASQNSERALPLLAHCSIENAHRLSSFQLLIASFFELRRFAAAVSWERGKRGPVIWVCKEVEQTKREQEERNATRSKKGEYSAERTKERKANEARRLWLLFYRPLVPNCWKNSSETGLV